MSSAGVYGDEMLRRVARGEIRIEPDTERERKVLRHLVQNRLTEWRRNQGFVLTAAGRSVLGSAA